MSYIRADNRAENHPKPVQEGERKLVGNSYVDYESDQDVLDNTAADFRPNKYYWVDGTLKHCDSDGVTLRIVGGGDNPNTSIKSLLFIIGTGTPTADFDGFKPAGNNLVESRLYGARIISVTVDNLVYNTFNPNAVQIKKVDTAPANSYLDGANIGGFQAGQSIIILYQ